MTEEIVPATVHGRCLVAPPARPGPAPLLVGFHGYGEDAETQMERLRAIPGSDDWHCVSIQALHPFYRMSTGAVVASWMTRQGRNAAIADNLAYVAACLDRVGESRGVVFAGFSQGVAMAYRAAVHGRLTASAVIAAGGDVPPELTPAELKRIPVALIARGVSDEIYTSNQFALDAQRLRDGSVSVRTVELNCAHEWPVELAAYIGDLLRTTNNAGAAPKDSGRL